MQLSLNIHPPAKDKDPLSTMYSTLPVSQNTSYLSTKRPNKFMELARKRNLEPLTIEPNQPVSNQIKDKYKTFTKWNYRDATLKSPGKSRKKLTIQRQKTMQDDALLNILVGFSQKVQKNQEIQEKLNKKKLVVEELVGVKAERRERFKKAQNPLNFIKHYMEKEKFKPSEEMMYLIEKVVELKGYTQSMGPTIDLQRVLKKIYKIMNLSVDCNQLRFLNLLILLCADICYEAKDFNRSFYFYNESRVASTYSNSSQIKAESLMGMGLVALQVAQYDSAIKIFKKNLQYAWSAKLIETELSIYDNIGKCYYHEGKMKESQYYHLRYIQSESEEPNSVIRKISSEMLDEYSRYVYSLEKDNLTSLFIEYLNLPITNFQTVPIPSQLQKKNYQNYREGESPRKNRDQKRFDFRDFPDVYQQIGNLIAEDYEFKTEIPNPEMHPIFVAEQKFGRRRKSIDFEQSSEYHRVVGASKTKHDFSKIYKFPLEQRIENVLKEPKNDKWWTRMIDQTKKDRTQKVGRLKEKIRISHQSYHKYPEERKRAQSLKNQKIKESFNKTLLDWIDPSK